MPTTCQIRVRRITALLAAAMIVLPTANAALAARPDTRAMTCENGRSLVRQIGAIVMTTGHYTYARIVSGRGYCASDEETELKIVPASDNPKCRIGYVCRTRINDDPFWRFRR